LGLPIRLFAECLQVKFLFGENWNVLFKPENNPQILPASCLANAAIVAAKCGEKCRRADAFFRSLVLEARSGGMSKTTAKIIKKHAMLAGHRMGFGPYVSAQKVAAETEHRGLGAQREPGRNLPAIW
jgi:hypothetical protein